MKTREIAPEWAYLKLEDEEKPNLVCTLPVIFSTALYALYHLARVQPPETVLIHEGSSEVGSAAIQIAKLADVEILPLETLDVPQMSRALRRLYAQERIGKVSISIETPESILQEHPLKYSSYLDDKKTKILVGCLGRLRRTISKWMVARGARNFVFIGRSGLAKKPARVLVHELQAAGAAVKVVPGDGSNPIEVQRAVAQSDKPIGGIIQAAMGLSEVLFTKQSNQPWHTGLGPKLQGCWNFHNASKAKMTS